jgi:hypothetical protein
VRGQRSIRAPLPATAALQRPGEFRTNAGNGPYSWAQGSLCSGAATRDVAHAPGFLGAETSPEPCRSPAL